MDPLFLSLDQVLEIHRDQIERYGGSPGLRDLGLLESALAMPRAGAGGQYFHSSMFEMAAAYLFHLVKNHPFVDGNKRTGTLAAYVFLSMNGFDLQAPAAQFEKLVLAVAAGLAGKDLVSEFLRAHSRPG